MDTSTTELIKSYLGAGVRWVLVLIGGVLVKKGIISDATSQSYVAQFTPIAIGLAMSGVALIWSLWQKKHVNVKVDTALTMPAGADREVLEAKVSQSG